MGIFTELYEARYKGGKRKRKKGVTRGFLLKWFPHKLDDQTIYYIHGLQHDDVVKGKSDYTAWVNSLHSGKGRSVSSEVRVYDNSSPRNFKTIFIEDITVLIKAESRQIKLMKNLVLAVLKKEGVLSGSMIVSREAKDGHFH